MDSSPHQSKDKIDDDLLALLLGDDASAETSNAISPRPPSESRPLSFAQQRLWFLQELEPTSPAYNITAAVRLSGHVDASRLEAALAIIVERHEVLRTGFATVDGQAQAVPQRDVRVPVKRISATEAELPARCATASLTPFDLHSPPLLQLTLIELSATHCCAVLVMHHIVSDAWSMDNLVRELGLAYTALLTGATLELPALAIQYGDYAHWQHERLNAGEHERQLAYWREQLAAPPELELPTDFIRPTSPDHQGAVISFMLPPETTAQLRRLMEETESTFFMTMLAAGHGWLHQLTQQDDVILGAPVANRGAAELEPLIGFFVNTLALRARIDETTTFRSLVAAARQATLEGFAHQDVPFEAIVHEVLPDRDPSRNPLFQVMLTADSTTNRKLQLGDLGMEPVDLPSAVAKFDLTLSLQNSPDEITGALEYATALFEPATASRMADQFLYHLARAVAAPDIPLVDLDRLSPAHRQTLADWENGPATPYPTTSLAAVFEQAVDATPSVVALTIGGDVLTYAELDQRANQLAHALLAREVGPNVPVGVAMERSMDLVVALLAILKAGGAYLAIDPAYPAERIAGMLTSADCRLVLTDPGGLPTTPATVTCLHLTDWPTALSASATSRPESTVGPDHLAYISFTSGTTGKPKGVAVPHRAVLRLVHGDSFAHFGADEVFLMMAPLAFDASTLELWGPLLHGGRLVIMPPGTPSLEQIGDIVRTERVTTLWLTSGLFNLMVDEQIDDLRGLHQLLAGGDVLSLSHVRQALAALPQTRLINGYGPTENTTFTCCHEIKEADLLGGSIPIGKPIAQTDVLVLDAHRRRVPIGVVGELYTGGDGLARGYIGETELTAQAFGAHPDDTNRRIYRTGDLVRWREDGTLEFRGRADRQVKIRGHRIELTEVEAALAHITGVTAAAVVVNSTGSRKQLVGYAASTLEATDVQAQLAAKLPDYLVPSVIITLPSLPLTSNGKIDRDALPAPAPAREDDDAVEPRTKTEKQVAEIWCGVLAIDQIGVHANYFASGGDSIGAIQVTSRLRRVGWQINVADLFRFPTVATLSTHLDRMGESTAGETFAPLVGAINPTPAQAWFLQHFTTDAHHFNQAVLLRPRSALAPARLQTAIKALWQQHDALRSVVRDGQLEILPVTTEISIDVLTVAAEAERVAHTEEVHRSFDLAEGPLWRVVHYRLPDTERLLLVAHHLVVDGVSWRLLIEDLTAGLAQLAVGQSLDLGPRAWPIDRWVESIRPTATSDSSYWQAAVDPAGVTWLAPETDAPNRFGDTRTIGAGLSKAKTQTLLTTTHQAFHTETDDLLLCALAQALQRWHGGQRTRIMMEGHGREGVDGAMAPESTVGWFTSLYPFVLELSGNDWVAQLKHLKEARRHIPQRGNSFGPLAYLTDDDALRRAAESVPLSFNYLGRFDDAPATELEFADESSGTPLGPNVIRRHEIDAGGAITGGCLNLSITFGSKRYAVENMQSLLDDWLAALETLIEACAQRTTREATPADFTSPILSLSAYDELRHQQGWSADAVEDIARLSPMQAGLLFESILEESSPAYFVQMAYRLRGSLDPVRFTDAWHQLAKRHTILRTSVLHEGVPEPLQVVWRERVPEITVVDLRAQPTAEQRSRIADQRAADLRRPFDLARDPLWRITIWQLSDDLTEIGWSYHHVLLDGWSLGLVHRDLFAYYLGETVLEPNLPYSQYIRWLDQRPPDAARAFWTDYLADYGDAARLRPEPQAQPITGHRHHTESLGQKLSDELRSLAASTGSTLATLMQAAWGVLLSRQNRTHDVVFGAIVSGRPAELTGVEKMVGLFICAVPVRIQYQDADSFTALLETAQTAALAAEPHHHLPLAEVQTLTPLGRELFDHLLVFENYPLHRTMNTADADALVIEHVEAHDRTHYDFEITIDPSESIEIRFGHEAAIYGPGQIQRLGARFKTLLNALVAAPDAPIGTLDSIAPAERTLVTHGFNQNVLPVPADLNLVDLLNDSRNRSGDSEAVAQDDVSWTYRELHDRAEALAQVLRQHDVGAETIVGLCVGRTPAMITGVLGILKSGGAYLPLDPLYPADRIRYMLDDAATRVIVTTRADHAVLGTSDPKTIVIYLEDLPTTPTIAPGSPPISPDQLAYVIYTSGSTGKPKGVAVTHRTLVNAAYAWRQAYDLGPTAKPPRILLMASLSFDVFAGDFIRALTNGGMLAICDAETRLDPGGLITLLQQYRITKLESTPGLILPLIEHLERTGGSLTELESLILGADTLRAQDYARLVRDYGDHFRIFNSYGVTEATIDTCVYESDQPIAVRDDESAPIGKPLANQRMYVLNDYGQPVGIGVPGELFIGGDGVARGYHQRPELTAERFPTMDPGDGEQRLYRTGDMARWRADGNLEFLGRGDRQVKIRGFRVEPGEIESVLRTCAGVTDALVDAREMAGGLELVAYVVSAQGTAADPTPWQAQLRATLTTAMVPAYWIPLDSIPLSPNGKVDRRALPVPDTAQNQSSGERVAPRTPTEYAIAAIWAKVLQVPDASVTDDFFEAGGHSLKAMQLLSRLHSDLGIKVPMRTFFEAASIEGLAREVDQSPLIEGHSTPTVLPLAPTAPHYPLSFAQQRLWLLHQLGGETAYNMPEAYRISGPLNPAALEQAIEQILQRHEALRTAFAEIDGDPAQRILPTVDYRLRRIDFSNDTDPEARARELADIEAAAPFDLTAPPLLRTTLIQLGLDRWVYLQTMHHIVGDGWSGNVLYREIFALYAAAVAGRPDPLPPLRLHYKDFACWQKSRHWAEDERFWLEALRGAPSGLALPYDFLAQGERDFRGDHLTHALSPTAVAALRAVAKRRRTTVANVLLGVFNLLLYQITKQADFCVGMSIANRNHPDLENLIGFFVNLLPIRVQLDESMDFDSLLDQVVGAADAAVEHQDYPFDLMVQELNPDRAANRQPLLNIVYAFQNFSDVSVDIGANVPDQSSDALPSPEITPFEHTFHTSKFDLTLFAEDAAGNINLTLEYDTGLFKAATIQRYLNLLDRFASMIAPSP